MISKKINQWNKNAFFCFLFLILFCSPNAFANIFSRIVDRILPPHQDNSGDWIDSFLESGGFEDHRRRQMKMNPGYDLDGRPGPIDLLAESDPHGLVEKHLPAVKSITHEEITGVLNVHGVSLESGSREEVYERFRDVFTRKKGVLDLIRRNSKIRNGYKYKVFGLWWLDPDFRRVIFESMTEEHIDSVNVLFKWWDEAKAVGAESRLKDFTESSLKKVGISLDEFMGLRLRPSGEGQYYLDPRMVSHPFLRAFLYTIRESEDFFDEWMKILSRPDAVGKDIT